MSRTLLHAVPHDKVADEDQHRFAVLVQRRPHLDQPWSGRDCDGRTSSPALATRSASPDVRAVASGIRQSRRQRGRQRV